ncbi:MAG TPA: cyclic nucleotide-binding domain-containing protein [Candidatus Dormibacteraeota bacterium]|jgi:CRP-like cAMP-binding protein|nr:cyclic nucleotide-binding domain-containing protein [Candidatus Dormibacteraeota bacterium]
MAHDEKVELLSRVGPLQGCSAAQLRTIARHAELTGILAGTVAIDEGAEAREVFLIVRGEADVSRGGRAVASLRPGDYFGEVGVLSSQRRDARVTARTNLEVLIFGRREFLALLATIPALNRSVLGTLASRLHHSQVAQLAV